MACGGARARTPPAIPVGPVCPRLCWTATSSQEETSQRVLNGGAKAFLATLETGVRIVRAAHRPSRKGLDENCLVGQPLSRGTQGHLPMTKPTNSHPPVRGKKIATALALAKGPEGVTDRESELAGGGSRLAAQIHKLKARGHRFRKVTEKGADGSHYARYWWIGWSPPGEELLRSPAAPAPPSGRGENAGHA